MNGIARATLGVLFLLGAAWSSPASAIVAVYVEDAAADPGARVSVALDLTVHEDLHGFSMTLQYDSDVLSVASVEGAELLEDWGTEGLTWDDDPSSGALVILGSSRGLLPISFATGDLLEIAFDVAGSAPAGTVSSLTLEPAEFFDEAGVALLSFTEDGSVTVTDPDAEPTPPPALFLLEVSDMVAAPGDAIEVEVAFSNEASVVALVFDLLVDGDVLQLDESRTPEIDARASTLTYAVTSLTEDAHRFGLTSMDAELAMPAGEGVILRLPYQISESARPGSHSLLLGLAAGFDDSFTEVEIGRVSAILTVTDPPVYDTGMPVDTGEHVDTGGDTGSPWDDTGESSPSSQEDTADTGLVSGGSGGATDGAQEETGPDKAGCGCAVSSAPPHLLVVAAVGLICLWRREGAESVGG